jgi:tetratricopeptide (TPR) repeat protein
MAQTSASLDQEIAQNLDRTDLGHWVAEHRGVFFAAIAAVFVLATSFLAYRNYQKVNSREIANTLYAFEQASLESLIKGELVAADFLLRLKALSTKELAHPLFLHTALKAFNHLQTKKDYQAAYEVLELAKTHHSIKSPASLFLYHSYAAAAEQVGKTDQAISIFEELIASGQKVLLVKSYLELGRLYAAKGEAEKAKKNFDYIVANYPNDELAKMARLYLQASVQPSTQK